MRLVKLFGSDWSIDLPPGDAPPTAFRIFKWGENSTTKGPVVLERNQVEQMVNRLEKHGADLTMDWNHASLRENPTRDDCKAAAWYDLELRDDGLWAVNVRWTPQALQDLKEKSYRYFSPAFWSDKRDRMVDWINMALLNQPATDQQKPLVAASEDRMNRRRKLLSHDSLAKHLKAHMECHSMSSEEMAKHCGIPHESLVKYAEGEAFPTAEHAKRISDATGMKASHIADYSEKFNSDGDDLEDDENGGEGDEEEQPGDHDDEEEKVKPNKTGKNRREIPEDGNELMMLTGAATQKEARKAFLQLQQAAGMTATLLSRFESLEKKTKEREVAELVRLGISDGKLAPAQKEWAMKLGARDPDELRELLEVTQAGRFRGANPPDVDLDNREAPFGGGAGGQPLGEAIAEVVRLSSAGEGHPAMKGKIKITDEMVRERAKKGHTSRSA